MFLAPDGDEIEVASNAERFLAGVVPLARLHDTESARSIADVRDDLASAGWFGLALSEADGGSGLSAVEHALFYREVGRCCGPIDVLAQSLAAMVADARPLRDALLSGAHGVALAVGDESAYRLLGSTDAALALHVARDESRLLDVSGTETASRPSLDPATDMRVIVGGTPRAIATSADRRVWSFGQLGTAAMQVGVAEAALDLIVEYAKVRETFGRKIGTYQAVRHACADMALRAEAARCQLCSAAAAMKEARPDAEVYLDAAKHLANHASVRNADVDIQLHGGIGVSAEHDAPLLLEHSVVLARLFGGTRPLLARLLHAELET